MSCSVTGIVGMGDSSSLSTGSALSSPLSVPCSPPLSTPAPARVVLPHENAAPNLLADQASHLTLSSPTDASTALEGVEAQDGLARKKAGSSHQRACSACSSSSSCSAPVPAPAHHPHASDSGGACGSPSAARGGSPPPSQQGARARVPAPSDAVAIGPSEVPVTSVTGAQRSSFSLSLSSSFQATASQQHSHSAWHGSCARGRVGLDHLQTAHVQGEESAHVVETANHQAEAIADTAMTLFHATSVPSWKQPSGFRRGPVTLPDLPNEVLLHVLDYLDVCDLLATSRVSPARLPQRDFLLNLFVLF